MTLQTSAGPLGFVGRIHTDAPRPALLVVNGSFPRKEHQHGLAETFKGVNVLVVNLPGMAGVPWSTPTVAELTQGLEEAVRLLLQDAPIVAFGASTGSLLTMGLTLPNIRRRVAVEPFFQTKDLWPFIGNSRERMAGNPGNLAMAHYFWDAFGIAPDRLENRDYRRLLDNITVPTDVIVGGAPLLPIREMDFWPSFTSEEDRAALAANPLVTLHVGPEDTGHGYGALPPSSTHVAQLLHTALTDIARFCA